VSNYSRFFNALLVKTPDHQLFFQDLRVFREQDHITLLLTTQHANESEVKQTYRECTRHFLASRFAHPWCRNEYGTAKHSFLDTTKSQQRRSEAKAKEEERLHKLLVPLWIPFRRRMMPTDEEMMEFLREEKLMEEKSKQSVFQQQEQRAALQELAAEVDDEDGDSVKENRNSARNASAHPNHPSGPTYFNAEAFVSENDEAMYLHKDRDGASQAASLFVGLAATSFLASNKRARKYLVKKMKK
jgi:hypothetical protein